MAHPKTKLNTESPKEELDIEILFEGKQLTRYPASTTNDDSGAKMNQEKTHTKRKTVQSTGRSPATKNPSKKRKKKVMKQKSNVIEKILGAARRPQEGISTLTEMHVPSAINIKIPKPMRGAVTTTRRSTPHFLFRKTMEVQKILVRPEVLATTDAKGRKSAVPTRLRGSLLTKQFSRSSILPMIRLSQREKTVDAEIIAQSEPTDGRTSKYTQIYLYMRLKAAGDSPAENAEMNIYHESGSVTILTERSTAAYNVIKLIELETQFPTFTITIDQDSIEDLNQFSDNPLLLTLYEYVEIEKEIVDEQNITEIDQNVDETGESDYFEAIAQGYIDLIPYFRHERFATKMQTFLYPINNPQLKTCKTEWEIYTLMPPLKNISLCNLIYITCESIYNPTDRLMADDQNLTVELSFVSNKLGDDNQKEKISICEFRHFQRSIINNNNNNQKWEELINKVVKNSTSLGILTGCKASPVNVFSHLFCTEGVNFGFESINRNTDYALFSNGLHRFALTSFLSVLLEDVVAFNEYQILVEVFDRREPEKILMTGSFDLSIFLYPNVTVCRFAVQLLPPIMDEVVSLSELSKSFPRKSKGKITRFSGIHSSSSIDQRSFSLTKKTTFIIINICLMLPIFDCFGPSFLSSDIKFCPTFVKPQKPKPRGKQLNKVYKEYDDFILYTIQNIIKRNYKAIDDSNREFFCCTMRNLSNKLLTMMACDYNSRIPTKTNNEFADLLTTVYTELEERNHKIIEQLDLNDLSKKIFSVERNRGKILDLFNTMKLMYEADNKEMANFLKSKIENEYRSSLLNFYNFLYDVEKGHYAAAKTYMNLSYENKDPNGEYMIDLIDIYMKYEELERLERFSEAMEQLFENLREFTDAYNTDIDVWILLHCYYKNCNYLAGISYTRWKYESLYGESPKELMTIPLSRWELHNNFRPILPNRKAAYYFDAMKLFLRLGLYKFAKVIYNCFNENFNEIDRHFIDTTFKIFFKEEVDETLVPKNFATEKMQRTIEYDAYLAQINGNLQYYRNNIASAMIHYQHIMNIEHLFNYHDFYLSLMRYGYHMLEQKQFAKAFDAFSMCCTRGFFCMIAQIAMGTAMYKLNRLPEAELYFALSTNHEFHIPDVWGYLAVINLKMGQNFKALESWKYAKINPNNVIGEEILAELKKIDHDKVDIYVDTPCEKIC